MPSSFSEVVRWLLLLGSFPLKSYVPFVTRQVSGKCTWRNQQLDPVLFAVEHSFRPREETRWWSQNAKARSMQISAISHWRSDRWKRVMCRGQPSESLGFLRVLRDASIRKIVRVILCLKNQRVLEWTIHVARVVLQSNANCSAREHWSHRPNCISSMTHLFPVVVVSFFDPSELNLFV